jgi:hypothetical protein
MEIREQFNTLPILAEMQRNLGVIKRIKGSGKNSVELRVTRWATPIGVLPIAIYAYNQEVNVTFGRNSAEIKNYLEKIRFPEGTTNLTWITSSSYLPLSKLSIDKDDEILTRYENLILEGIKKTETRDSFRNSLKYLTSELVTNIKEHAHIDHYWILAQYWPTTKTCQIAIADTGAGYLESYRNTPYEVKTHKEAITNAINGNSSKDDVERGAGIPGMIKIFCEGYGGDISIMSGDTLLFISKANQNFYELDVPWSGAFIGIQFKLSVIDALAYLSGD